MHTIKNHLSSHCTLSSMSKTSTDALSRNQAFCQNIFLSLSQKVLRAARFFHHTGNFALGRLDGRELEGLGDLRTEPGRPRFR